MRNRYMGFLSSVPFLFLVIFVASLTTYGDSLFKESPLSVLPKVGAYSNTPLQGSSVGVYPQQVDEATKAEIHEKYGKLPL